VRAKFEDEPRRQRRLKHDKRSDCDPMDFGDDGRAVTPGWGVSMQAHWYAAPSWIYDKLIWI